jgi:hypothetical protein
MNKNKKEFFGELRRKYFTLISQNGVSAVKSS